MAELLTGVIERITFHNLDSGYCVLRVQAKGHRELVTVVGTSQQVIAGEYVKASGDWITDRQHGLQFKAAEIKTTPPHTSEGIAKYLGSGLVKGIGPRFAQRIVDAFGERTLDVIDQSPTFLSQVKGIGPKLIEKIRSSWKEQVMVRSIMVFLHSYGIGTARAVRIFKQYGENAIEVVKSNPYRLSTDIWGVGFQTADELALKMGLPRDSPFRAQAAVRHVLQKAQSDGHVCLPEELTVSFAEELTKIPPDGIAAAITTLREQNEIVLDPPDRASRLAYLQPLYLAELGVARQVKALALGGHPLAGAKVDAAVEWAEKRMKITLAASQKQAIAAAVSKKLAVVTGGPGTGKTTIVRAHPRHLHGQRAQSRSRSADRPGRQTPRRNHRPRSQDHPSLARIRSGHRRLPPQSRQPARPRSARVDEMSMVDLVLMNQLLRAVPRSACVVLVGDVDQLPSVGAGAVLADLIGSGVVPVAQLTEVHRQAKESGSCAPPTRSIHGDEPESAPRRRRRFLLHRGERTARRSSNASCRWSSERIPAKFGLDPFRDIQVLTPQVKTDLGVIQSEQGAARGAEPRPRRRRGEALRHDLPHRRQGACRFATTISARCSTATSAASPKIDAVEQVLFAEFDGRRVAYDFCGPGRTATGLCMHDPQGARLGVSRGGDSACTRSIT